MFLAIKCDCFYRHRLDILQTIRSGVLKLSSVDGQSTASVNCEPVEAGDNRQIPEWRKIVDARVRIVFGKFVTY